MNATHIIGIDEVGRGPLAGPVAVGAVCMTLKAKSPQERIWMRGVKDSKQLTAEARGEWCRKIKAAEKRGELRCAVTCVSSKVIDERGLSYAIRRALKASLRKLNVVPARSEVLLDGGLRAPGEFTLQKTIVKGDEKEPIIALASIVAKVTRDALMSRYAKKYPGYRFDLHKGYGTKLHYEEIMKNKLSLIHRKSFIKTG